MTKALTSAAHTTAPGLERDIASFARHLRAAKRVAQRGPDVSRGEPTTLPAGLVASGRAAALEGLRREALEAFIVDLLAPHSPATAQGRYVGLQTLFRWPTEELIAVSPMAASRPSRGGARSPLGRRAMSGPAAYPRSRSPADTSAGP